MQLSVLTLDYDGTIAQDGVLDPEVRQGIHEVRAHDVTVAIVTGRILDDLRRVMGDLRLVDAVVAENGAVLAFPASGRSFVLAPPASERMLAELERYCVCVIDPEGDYRTLEALPGVRTFGGLSTPPAPAEVVHALRYPDVSVLVDLSAVSHADKVDLEDAYEQGRRLDVNNALAQIIRDRYEGFSEGDKKYKVSSVDRHTRSL